jgi:2-polyprenyl-6-methoxyphenol hydroxylase-like FAD-dependent oxidoreductase
MVTPDMSVPAPASKVDFLVVGGGPVGLLAANLIVQAGLTVRIVGKLRLIYSIKTFYLCLNRY